MFAQRFNETVQPALKSLERMGLHDVTNVNLAKVPPRQGAGMFERLSLVRAVAVRLHNDELIGDVLAATNGEFDIVLDVRTKSDPVLAREKNLSPSSRWSLACRFRPRRGLGARHSWNRGAGGCS
ncbi:MAG: hypothetical protein KL863_22605 [Rhizobium sp.]|nr:hypothetical protein [Rhizobium sp.]